MLLFSLFLITACARPLTPTETALLAPIHGETLDTAPIRLGANPLIGLGSRTFPTRPRTTCRERIGPPPQGPTFEATTAGAVLFNRLFLNPDFAFPDYVPDYPEAINLAAAMFFVHEMTHVWQWQNRALTGYHPWRAAREQVVLTDPYLFDPDDTRRFLDYGYEQQASLVEEYLCCATLDPEGARTERLHALLTQVMPAEPPAAFRSLRVVLPYDGAETAGICS